jgi:L,D-transpeptidase ErfK/SrfK
MIDPMRNRRLLGFGPSLIGFFGSLVSILVPAAAAEFPLAPHQTAVGASEIALPRQPDTMMDLGRRYDLGFTQLMAANRGVNPWMPAIGKPITVPNYYLLPDAPQSGLVINLAEQRLYYYPAGNKTVETYPIGIGVIGAGTPLGMTRISAKEADPAWYPPPSIHRERPELPSFIAAGPDNPLGAYALRLGATNILLHGTNKPDGVGRDVSHGCMHLYPEDIERLFHEIPVGMAVRVVDQEVKAAWVGVDLFVEIHPTKDQGDELDITNMMTPAPPPPDLEGRVKGVAGAQAGRVDWTEVRRVGLERTGIPTRVTMGGPSL